MFMAQDRADIKYATKECARELSAPTGLSMRKVKRIVKYVEGTADYGTGIRKDEKAWDQIDVYCDSDYLEGRRQYLGHLEQNSGDGGAQQRRGRVRRFAPRST